MSQKQLDSRAEPKVERSADLIGNKSAELAAKNARDVLKQAKARAIRHYECGFCKNTGPTSGSVCNPIPVYED